MVKKRSSPERMAIKDIGGKLPDSVKRDIRLPFIQMRKLNKDKSTLGKFMLPPSQTQQ